MTNADLDRIEKQYHAATGFEVDEIRDLVAEVRRLRGTEATNAELREIRKWLEEYPYWTSGAHIKTLFAHIDFLSNAVIADLKTDLANESLFAAGFRACRDMAVDIASGGRLVTESNVIRAESYLVLSQREIAEKIAALTPEQYAAQKKEKE